MKRVRQEQLDLNPHTINDNVWYYQEPKGLRLVHEIFNNGVYVRTDQIIISWKRIKVALSRYEKAVKDNAQ
jgi:hypothetical protein